MKRTVSWLRLPMLAAIEVHFTDPNPADGTRMRTVEGLLIPPKAKR